MKEQYILAYSFRRFETAEEAYERLKKLIDEGEILVRDCSGYFDSWEVWIIKNNTVRIIREEKARITI